MAEAAKMQPARRPAELDDLTGLLRDATRKGVLERASGAPEGGGVKK
jgi:hypothetical protein